MGGPVACSRTRCTSNAGGGAASRRIRINRRRALCSYMLRSLSLPGDARPCVISNTGCLRWRPAATRKRLIGEEWKPRWMKDELSLQPGAYRAGDVIFFDSFAPHASKPNFITDVPRRIRISLKLASHGRCRVSYYAYNTLPFPARQRGGMKERSTSFACKRLRWCNQR